MTTLLYVRGEGGQPLPTSDLQSSVRRRSGNQSIRLVARPVDHGQEVEPFVGSAAVAALVEIPRKRDDALVVVRALVTELKRQFDEVSVVRRREGKPEPAPIACRSEELGLALESDRCCLRIAGVMRAYRAEDVEVIFYEPRSVEGRVVTGYLSRFDVVAETESAAMVQLRDALSPEGRLGKVGRLEVTDMPTGVDPRVDERVGDRWHR